MGLDYITYKEVPAHPKCPDCGSTHIKIWGAKKVEYELEIVDGKETYAEESGVEWDVVYGIECLKCGVSDQPDEIYRWGDN